MIPTREPLTSKTKLILCLITVFDSVGSAFIVNGVEGQHL